MSTDWEAVYRGTYHDLVRFIYRKVWDTDRAHDLAQEAFVRSLDQSPDNPKGWLFRVAANLAADEIRTTQRRKQHLILIKGEAEVKQESAPGPADNYDRQERVEAVRRALEELSERDRDVLLLWDAGMDYREIAAETGLSPGAVGTTLARARRRLVDAHAALERRNVARG